MNLVSTIDDEGNTFIPYEKATGEEYKGEQFVTGELVMYKPASTMHPKLPKVGERCRAGIFMRYYTSGGKWNGQYVVADIEDFANKNMHAMVGPTHFKLHLHRTEVCKRPSWSNGEPVFPCEEKYRKANYTIEGQENKQLEFVPDHEDIVEKYNKDAPELTKEEIERYSAIHDEEMENFKYSKIGRKLKTNKHGVCTRLDGSS